MRNTQNGHAEVVSLCDVVLPSHVTADRSLNQSLRRVTESQVFSTCNLPTLETA